VKIRRGPAAVIGDRLCKLSTVENVEDVDVHRGKAQKSG
jgi:hypothetical protein